MPEIGAAARIASQVCGSGNGIASRLRVRLGLRAYVEAGYKITRHLQPVFRYEWAREGLVTPVVIPDSFKSHRDIAGGLDYWVNPKAVLKFSYHHVNGNMLSVPRGYLDLASLFAIPKTTDMATFGLAFVF